MILAYVQTVVLQVVEQAINRMIDLDPLTREALIALEGRSVEFLVQIPMIQIRILVQNQRLCCSLPEKDLQADLVITSTLSGLVRQLPWIQTARRHDSYSPSKRMQITGDAEFARRLQQLFSGFDPDWQHALIVRLGPIVGGQIATVLDHCYALTKEQLVYVGSSTAQYLTEETRAVLSRAELEAFYEAVDRLQEDTERLAARLARVQKAGSQR